MPEPLKLQLIKASNLEYKKDSIDSNTNEAVACVRLVKILVSKEFSSGRLLDIESIKEPVSYR